MEASGLVFKTLVSPLAAVLPLLPPEEPLPGSAEPDLQNNITWALSPLNPKNRFDTLASAVRLPLIQWHISGCSVNGSQFYAYPLFALGRPPLFIDVYIPDQCKHPPALRLLLKSGAALTCPRNQVAHLSISCHVLHALAVWSSRVPDFEAKYQSLPFGSCIVVENIASDVHDMRISMVPNHKLEDEFLSLTELQELWQSSSSDEKLEMTVNSISISNLKLIDHTHETISIVSIPLLHDSTTRFIFKAVTPARFASKTPIQTYHELKLLMAMEPHPNITARPLYVVTGTPKLGICGFILPYYQGESLLDVLTLAGTRPLLDRVRWSRQITSALIHIHTCTIARYHADLKPDNVMLTAGSDAVLVDFEQRGGWASWIAPEVCFIWHLVVIANSTAVPSETAGRYTRALQRLVAISSEDTSYRDIAWTYLSHRERESAMVFALGKVLWCIFENQPTIYTDVGWGMTREAATWIDDEHSWRFPEFRRTPEALRSWIERCTAGADEWDVQKGRSVYFDLERGVFIPVGGTGGKAIGDESRTKRAAKAWWEKRVIEAEAFLEARVLGEDYNGIQAAARRRPALRDVLDMLVEFEVEISASSHISKD